MYYANFESVIVWDCYAAKSINLTYTIGGLSIYIDALLIAQHILLSIHY
jgi:hypothetical protein